LALHLGLRQGELIDLFWRDIDLTSTPPTLRVSESKTPAGVRTIVLSPMLVQTLRDHWAFQQDEREAGGVNWKEHGRVFPSERGTPLRARNLYRHFQQTLEKAELSHMPFHDLRHTCASLLAEAGVHPSVAREILGHEHISTTMDIYTHAAQDEVRRAIEGMQDVV
jgi:integrase